MSEDPGAPAPQEEAPQAAAEGHAAEASRPGAAKWGEPLVAFDRFWTRWEVLLALVAFVLEASSMVLWVGLKGFSASADHVSAVMFRAIVGATVLGTAAHLGFAKKTPGMRQIATLVAIAIGLVTARLWLNVGREYSSNLLNWYQQASFLTLLGGLRGVGTRLTMLLALVGGSLATARGRHIVIDIVTRFVGPGIRTGMVLLGWLASAAVCAIAAWGFFDHIAIESFEARADDSAGAKITQVAARLADDVFVARKQIALDFKTTPHVLFRGEPYSDWLTGKEWNAWVDSAGFPERYGKEAAEGLKIPDSDTRAPLVIIPGRGEPRGELINAMYLVFPIGLLIIGLRFLLRGLLVLSGQASVESDEADEYKEYEQKQAGTDVV